MGRYGVWIVILVLFAVASRLALTVAYPMDPIEKMRQKPGDEQYYFHSAENLIEHGEYTGTNGKKAYIPPGYPVYLAGNILAYGSERRPIQLTQNGLYLLSVLLLAWVVRRAYGMREALIAAGWLLLNPVWFIVPQQAVSENVFIFLVVLALSLFTALAKKPQPVWAFLMGLLFAASALTREVGLIYGLVAALALWRIGYRPKSKGSRWAVPSLAVAGLVIGILPWTIRNAVVYKKIVPITTNSNINLYIGNNPRATGDFIWVLPGDGVKLWNTYAPNGANEIKVSEMAGREAMRYMKDNPDKVVALWPWKLAKVWLPPEPGKWALDKDSVFRWYRTMFWIATLILGLWGLLMIRGTPLGWYLWGIILLTTAIHVITYSRIEHRSPLDFLLVIPVSVAIAAAFGVRTAAKGRA